MSKRANFKYDNQAFKHFTNASIVAHSDEQNRKIPLALSSTTRQFILRNAEHFSVSPYTFAASMIHISIYIFFLHLIPINIYLQFMRKHSIMREYKLYGKIKYMLPFLRIMVYSLSVSVVAAKPLCFVLLKTA
eukprot:462232_1